MRTVGVAVDAFLARGDLAASSRRSYVQRDQRRVLNELLALLDELAANTIDRQLAKSDIQLGLEYVLGFGPPLPPRRPPT